MSDLECLQLYVRDSAQAAFATLVGRYVDLVYSAALRQVRSPQLAEEVAQSVFLDLSRRAAAFTAQEPLAPWLYVVTRRTAIDTIRRESRRLERERIAAEIAAMKTPPHAWPHVERVLDEAMETLNDTERTALVLRFFQNLSLREVGTALGISEDTAQKRVSRALDRLRAGLQTRGVTVSALALGTELSAHAVTTAPAALGGAITAASIAAPPIAAAGSIAPSLAMTTAQKCLVAASLALAVGGVWFEAAAVSTRQDELAALTVRADALQRDLARLRASEFALARARADATRSAFAPVTPAPPAASSDAALEAEMQAWMERAVRLNLLLEERPELTIPEIKQFFTAERLFNFAVTAKFDSEKDIRATLANLRQGARNDFANKLPEALRAYLRAHDNTLPATVAALGPYFETPIDPAILARYEFRFSGPLEAIPRRLHSSGLIDEIGPVDPTNDSQLTVGRDGFTLGGVDPLAGPVRAALRGFQAARNGALPATPAEVIPFFDPPLSPADQERINRRAGSYLGTPPAGKAK